MRIVRPLVRSFHLAPARWAKRIFGFAFLFGFTFGCITFVSFFLLILLLPFYEPLIYKCSVHFASSHSYSFSMRLNRCRKWANSMGLNALRPLVIIKFHFLSIFLSFQTKYSLRFAYIPLNEMKNVLRSVESVHNIIYEWSIEIKPINLPLTIRMKNLHRTKFKYPGYIKKRYHFGDQTK